MFGSVLLWCASSCFCASWEGLELAGRVGGAVSRWEGTTTFRFCPPTAPWGKRGWKMIHTLLRGMVLYFLKVGRQSAQGWARWEAGQLRKTSFLSPCALWQGEDLRLEGESLVGQMVDEPVGVHHSLATPATHYTKKPHVFQLRTADWRLYLFQAP